ncbi:acyl-CoA dehydrogenase family protein [Spiractinospora alimapuensis]|uniref:acyl-CoA dehydrogenase family protein n=1 Tax=Spiractinospora alimapuensis TaxID=2820884 RepID=UPI001F3A5993|nr:acyl-CoA dehydrogenase [Spiractinospora alimapuensis]QVQ53714.1 acyl-CoA dehydrogenase family protein [Spiractinospora alimapuensis]
MTRHETPEKIDVDALRTLLDGRWGHARDVVRTSMRGDLFTPVYGLDTEGHRDRVAEQMRVLAATPLPGFGFPVEYGGTDDPGAATVAFEMTVMDQSLMVKLGVQWGLFGGAILSLGTRRHHERYLRPLIALDLPGCFAMTESGHGSDVQSLRTTATYDPDTEEFVVHTPDDDARKDYIGNAARDGRLAVVFAQLITGGTNHGVHALVVPIRHPDGTTATGVRIEDCGRKAGLNGVDNGRIWFDRVRVPREALLNRYGDVAADGTYTSPVEKKSKRFFTMLGTLVRGRVSVAGGAGAAARAALTIALRYADRRRQFPNPETGEETRLLDYRTHQRRLLIPLARTYALAFAQEELTRTMHEIATGAREGEHAQRELESRAAGLKAVATWHAMDTIQTARESCGGVGYLAENRFAGLREDTDVFTTFEGDNTVLLQLVAKGLLTNYKQEFESLETMDAARFVAGQFLGAVIERTTARSTIERLVTVAPGREDNDALFNRGWQVTMFEDRERHIVEGLARRMRKAGRSGSAEAVNDCQDHMVSAARAHIDRVVLEAFVGALERCEDPGVRSVLEKVCDLYVLSTIEEDRGWFLEHDRLRPTRAKAVTDAVNTLCARLRPHAGELVDAFALPDEWLGAPIAR